MEKKKELEARLSETIKLKPLCLLYAFTVTAFHFHSLYLPSHTLACTAEDYKVMQFIQWTFVFNLATEIVA